MAKQQRSIIGYLTLTAWESWEAEPHWRNAVVIALVGSIAFSMASPNSPAPVSSQQTAQQPMTNSTGGQSNVTSTTSPPPIMVNSGATLITPTSKVPQKLKPKLSADDVVIKESEEKTTDDFGRSYGE